MDREKPCVIMMPPPWRERMEAPVRIRLDAMVFIVVFRPLLSCVVFGG